MSFSSSFSFCSSTFSSLKFFISSSSVVCRLLLCRNLKAWSLRLFFFLFLSLALHIVTLLDQHLLCMYCCCLKLNHVHPCLHFVEMKRNNTNIRKHRKHMQYRENDHSNSTNNIIIIIIISNSSSKRKQFWVKKLTSFLSNFSCLLPSSSLLLSFSSSIFTFYHFFSSLADLIEQTSLYFLFSFFIFFFSLKSSSFLRGGCLFLFNFNKIKVKEKHKIK